MMSRITLNLKKMGARGAVQQIETISQPIIFATPTEVEHEHADRHDRKAVFRMIERGSSSSTSLV
jgi:hypothetical protein